MYIYILCSTYVYVIFHAAAFLTTPCVYIYFCVQATCIFYVAAFLQGHVYIIIFQPTYMYYSMQPLSLQGHMYMYFCVQATCILCSCFRTRPCAYIFLYIFVTADSTLLAHASTVHKSQGLSADYVEVHCSDMHYPRLLSVSISRVKSPAGLRIVGLETRHVLKPNAVVLQLIEETNFKNVSKDLSCCTVIDNTVKDTEFIYEFSDDDDFELNNVTASEALLPSGTRNDCNAPVVIELLRKQLVKSPVTTQQEASNKAIYQLMTIDLTPVTDFIQTSIQQMYQSTIAGKIKEGKPNSEVFNEFASRMYNFSLNALTDKLNNSAIPPHCHTQMRQLCRHMRKSLFDKEAAA